MCTFKLEFRTLAVNELLEVKKEKYSKDRVLTRINADLDSAWNYCVHQVPMMIDSEDAEIRDRTVHQNQLSEIFQKIGLSVKLSDQIVEECLLPNPQ